MWPLLPLLHRTMGRSSAVVVVSAGGRCVVRIHDTCAAVKPGSLLACLACSSMPTDAVH
jgi:hypothetical protein